MRKKDIEFMRKGYKGKDSSRLALGLIKPKSKVLSAGCGPGRELEFLKKINCDVVAIDHDKEMIELSQEIEPRAKYVLGEIYEYEKPDSFDYIVCLFNTLDYLRSEKEVIMFLRKSYDNLKRGGKLIITIGPKNWNLRRFFRAFFSFKYNRIGAQSYKKIMSWFGNLAFKINKVRIGDELLVVARK